MTALMARPETTATGRANQTQGLHFHREPDAETFNDPMGADAIASTTVTAMDAMDDDWRSYAVCATDAEPDRWVDLPPVRIHGRNNPAYDEHVNALAAVCSTCPVMDTCLGNSLAMNVRGVFAGHDEYDRADMREALGLPVPPLMPPPETEDDVRLIEQQFTALRLARRNMSNKQIAAELGVSTMTVSRLLASEDRPSKRRTRKKTAAQS